MFHTYNYRNAETKKHEPYRKYKNAIHEDTGYFLAGVIASLFIHKAGLLPFILSNFKKSLHKMLIYARVFDCDTLNFLVFPCWDMLC